MTSNRFAELMQLDDDELWVILGAEVSPGIGIRDPAFLRAAARAWFNGQLQFFREAVCGDPRILAIEASGEREVLVSAVFDALAPICELPAAATASLLLARYGIGRLCQPDAQK